MIKKTLKWIAAAAILLVIGGTVAFVRWRHRQIDRLESNSRIVETARGLVEYTAVGQGRAVLVLHGTIGGYDQLEPLVKMLDSKSYRFILVSRPGYLGTPLSTGQTFEAQADAYAALLDVLGIDQVAIVAVSGGGPSALQFALRHPDRCWGLVMMSANADVQAGRTRAIEHQGGSAGPPPAGITKVIFSDFTSWVLAGASKLFPRQFLTVLVGKGQVEAVLGNATKRHLYAESLDSLALLSRRRAGALNDGDQFRTFTGHPWQEITAPMLILHGTSDQAVGLAEPRYLDEMVPHSTYVEIEGGTHFMIISHHDVLSPLILDFLNVHMP